MCVAEPTITHAFAPIAREVSSSLQTFVAEEWTEPWSTPEAPCVSLAGELYKTTAILYGLLSLPLVLAFEFATALGASPALDTFMAVENGRIYYGDRLMSLVQQAIKELPRPQGVSWPIAVLGVAKHDAPQEEKDKLLAYLQILRLQTGADSGAASIDIKLRDFWYFGYTEWEQCYHEPINVIS